MRCALFVMLLNIGLPVVAAQTRPNVLVVMVDDMGFSDLGCYGGEIETPTLDRLAGNGLRFTQFYNTAKCHSSRVALLSGQYCYQAGNVSLSHCVTSAEMLAKAGYFTMMSGKWHLQKEPTDFGFHRYFGHLSGACNYYLGDKTFRLNGEKWSVPEKGFYTTVAKVDHAIGFLKEARETKKPWYLYVAFNAPHAPLQPLKEDYKKYEGRYRKGWDAIRAARFKKQKKLGLFGKDITVSPRPEHIRAWDKLDADWQAFEEKRMTAIAGMIDRIDQEMGRLVANLEKASELENTMILFISDNGACPYDRARNQRSLDQVPWDPKVRWSDSTGWAWARNTPFRFYKQNQFEGGVCTPAIVHWPAGLKTKAGSVCDRPISALDIVPTCLKGAGIELPVGLDGMPIPRIMDELPKVRDLFWRWGSHYAVRSGDWKLLQKGHRSPRDPCKGIVNRDEFIGKPCLFNLKDDPSESRNLFEQHPEIVQRLQKLYATWSREVDRTRAGQVSTAPDTSMKKRKKRKQKIGGYLQ